MKTYRVVLTTGDKWVVRAATLQAARGAALTQCPALRLFGTHIERVECVQGGGNHATQR
jgi:uncharacterized protein (DUF2237 family)